VMRAKVSGARNLAEATKGQALDFFVLFSSAASLLGSPGQANYAAANAYLDGLARGRAQRGEAGLSINWGAWAEVGLATREDRARHVSSRGLRSMPPAEAVEAMWRLLGDGTRPQAAVMSVDWGTFLGQYPVGIAPSLLLGMAREKWEKEGGAQAAQQQEFRRRLEATPPARRKEVMVAHLRSLVAQVMGYEAEHPLDVRSGFFEMGMDSLMIVDLRNRLQFSLGLTVPSTVIFDYATTDALAGYLVDRIIPPDPAPDAVEVEGAKASEEETLQDESGQVSEILGEMNALSEDDLVRLLES
ncbi:MAG TPA: beta-ketoacyl reductase, partial [Pyrinomonadaceae bacterium]